MSKINSKEICLPLPGGDVRIRSFCSPEAIRQSTLDHQFTVHPDYKSLCTSRETLVKCAEQPDANVVLALTAEDRIIGYGVLTYPEAGERWIELGPKIMMELKAIEVCRSRRTFRIAPVIFRMLLAFPQVEEKIIYLVGYSWTWDLNATGKTAQQYRRMLVSLFKPHGFEEFRTNEPNICLKPENLFMCRVGGKINPVILDRFKWLRFGLSPWTWNVK